MRTSLIVAFLLLAPPAMAQFGPAGPATVGIVKVSKRPVTETQEFVGRVQAIDKVDIVARVSAVLVERRFTEGAEVAAGDLLFRLERDSFVADLAAKRAAVAQTTAMHRNAALTTERAQALLGTPAGNRANYDAAVAQQANWAAQIDAARAQVQMAEINLAYTEIHAPIAGRIGRAAVSPGNLVGPTSGPLVTVVSQDPMYVTFPVPARTAAELRARHADGYAALAVKLRLADGTAYAQSGTIDYADPSVTPGTDTQTFRARIHNPLRAGVRDLVDGAFVTVTLEGVSQVPLIAAPRAAIAQDQQGAYVMVADGAKAALRRVRLGQSLGAMVAITDGLAEGDSLIVDGLQRIRPGADINPVPAGAPPPAPPGVTPPKPAG